MRRLLKLRYIGTAYHGWQVQNNALSVQQCVQDALEKVLGHRPGLTGCSRTDSGVHAKEFCAHFDTQSLIPGERLTAALNVHLPRDIGIISCREVPDGFHARYSCSGKTYCYQILCSRVRDPFLEGFCWQVKFPVDKELLDRCCRYFVGRHDFAAFCASGSSVQDTVRTVSDCHAECDGDLIKIYITADGFLYNMVRIIAGTLIDCQSGRIAEPHLPQIIAAGDRKAAGRTAPPEGLFLEKVHYADIKEDSRG